MGMQFTFMINIYIHNTHDLTQLPPLMYHLYEHVNVTMNSALRDAYLKYAACC